MSKTYYGQKTLNLISVILLLLLCFPYCRLSASGANPQSWVSGDFAIKNVTVIPMNSDTMLYDQTIIIRGRKIYSLGASGKIKIPGGIAVIDGRGKFLVPGLVDSHIHLRHADTTALIKYLEAGVTTVREMNGRPFLLEWRQRIDKGSLSGPNMYIACPTIGNFSSPKEGFKTPKNSQEADSLVKKYAGQGYDWIKVYSFMSRDIYHALINAANKYGIPIGGHPPLEISFRESLRMKSIEHLLGYLDHIMTPESEKLDKSDLRGVFHAVEFSEDSLVLYAELTKEAGIWNCPTILTFDHILPAEQVRKSWERNELRKLGHENRLKIVRALHKAGAKILVGTDSDAGEDIPAGSIHEELKNLSDAGLSPFEILRAATKDAAEFLGSDEFGIVSVGKRADLLLLKCNPLEDITCLQNPELIIIRGNILKAAK